ncbi:unnamed protein product [Gongylonema pulchrum]|uniref:Secreted protein n=1 Tax=Gongylonema pulchrum TaxID=637853 RepID=A0A183D755_9BILA|nr:unnamed protein product [Gongylonema pulchrum]
MLILPTLFSLFAFVSVLLLVYRMWTMERPRMAKAQAAAFILYDQVIVHSCTNQYFIVPLAPQVSAMLQVAVT